MFIVKCDKNTYVNDYVIVIDISRYLTKLNQTKDLWVYGCLAAQKREKCLITLSLLINVQRLTNAINAYNFSFVKGNKHRERANTGGVFSCFNDWYLRLKRNLNLLKIF